MISHQMKNVLHLSFTILLTAWILFPFDLLSQNDQRSLTKVGGFLNFNDPSGFFGFSLNFEHEQMVKRSMSFSHGFRLDYEIARSYLISNPSQVKFFSRMENLVIGYELKFYPFYYRSQKPYHGIFMGIDACYFTPINQRYKYGPGFGTLVGYQYVFKKNISIGCEASMIYMQNINDQAFSTNAKDRYIYFLACVKVGIKIKRNR